MTSEHRRGTGSGPVPDPPPTSGITVEEHDHGVRIRLPRLYSRGDVIVGVLAGGVAVWMAAWVDAMAADPASSLVGRAVMAAIGLAFGLLAVAQGLRILAPRVIEARDDRLVLSRAVGVRRVFPHAIPRSTIRSIERAWDEDEALAGGPGVVVIRTDRDTHRIGKHLDPTAVSWLEDAVRELAEG
ncbi:MAG: hypothetical protein ACOCUW_02785 [Gemmatimonadota bacterium]